MLRGLALLGILLINIQSFAMISAAFSFPNLHMDVSGLNLVVWTTSHVFADLKFMAIFSMLFGAGIILSTRQQDQIGHSTLFLHNIRTFWLLMFGVLHAYFIWYGEILVTYALCGFVVYWFRDLSVPLLWGLGGISLSIALLIMVSAGIAPADVQLGISRDFVPNNAEIANEIARYQGAWANIQHVRLIEALDMQFSAIPLFLFWQAGGLMLIGMALFKFGVFNAERSPKFYLRLLGVIGVIGFSLIGYGTVQLIDQNCDPGYRLLQYGGVYNYLGSIAGALFYVGCMMLIAQKQVWPAAQARLAAVGRMAFTNYILQSVIATTFFTAMDLDFLDRLSGGGSFLLCC